MQRTTIALILLAGHLTLGACRGETASSTGPGRLGEIVTIPAGDFLMGNNGHEGFEGPEEFTQHSITQLPNRQVSGVGPGDSDYIGFRVAR